MTTTRDARSSAQPNVDEWSECRLVFGSGYLNSYCSLVVASMLMHEIWMWENTFADEAQQDLDQQAISRSGGSSKCPLSTTLSEMVPSEEELLPCHYFDVVCGSSGGGLLAMLIGRLRMPINEASRAFFRASQTMFTPRSLSRVTSIFGSRYRSRDLIEAVHNITTEHLDADTYCQGHDIGFRDPSIFHSDGDLCTQSRTRTIIEVSVLDQTKSRVRTYALSSAGTYLLQEFSICGVLRVALAGLQFLDTIPSPRSLLALYRARFRNSHLKPDLYMIEPEVRKFRSVRPTMRRPPREKDMWGEVMTESHRGIFGGFTHLPPYFAPVELSGTLKMFGDNATRHLHLRWDSTDSLSPWSSLDQMFSGPETPRSFFPARTRKAVESTVAAETTLPVHLEIGSGCPWKAQFLADVNNSKNERRFRICPLLDTLPWDRRGSIKMPPSAATFDAIHEATIESFNKDQGLRDTMRQAAKELVHRRRIRQALGGARWTCFVNEDVITRSSE